MKKQCLFIITTVTFFLIPTLVFSNWSAPENRLLLLKKSNTGDQASQDILINAIYKGSLRFPKNYKKTDQKYYTWLERKQPNESLERKVVRFIYLGYAENQEKLIQEVAEKANKNDSFAQRILGSFYFHTDAMGDLRREGLKWYEKAAEKGHARAQMSLALRYIKGPNLVDKGVEYVEVSSKSGLPEAQSTLGTFYHDGQFVKKNKKTSFQWIYKAANSGDGPSQYVIGISFLEGKNGFDKNVKIAIKWLKKAALNNDPNAQFALGWKYLNGEDVEKDKEKAVNFLHLAADNGIKQAHYILEEYKQK